MSKGKLTPMPFGKARLRPAEERTSNPAGITAPGQYPTVRMRRNRQDGSVRRLVAENHLGVEDLIWPAFAIEGEGERMAVHSMPGVERLTIDLLTEEAAAAAALGIPAMAIFPFVDPALDRKSKRLTSSH